MQSKSPQRETGTLDSSPTPATHVPGSHSQQEGAGVPQHAIALVERLFECRDGPRRSYVEIDGIETRYVTLGYIANDAEQCVRAILDDLWHVAQRMPLGWPLYWRYEGRILVESEQPQHLSDDRQRWRAKTRIALPGYDWERYADPMPKEEGAPFPRIGA